MRHSFLTRDRSLSKTEILHYQIETMNSHDLFMIPHTRHLHARANRPYTRFRSRVLTHARSNAIHALPFTRSIPRALSCHSRTCSVLDFNHCSLLAIMNRSQSDVIDGVSLINYITNHLTNMSSNYAVMM